MALSDAVTFIMGAYTPPNFITALPLDMSGDPSVTYKLSGTFGDCRFAWCIVSASAEKWSEKYVAA
jgi:hypothetical protein